MAGIETLNERNVVSVYAIQPSAGGLIKLGEAGGQDNKSMTPIISRRKQLQTGSCMPLRIVGVYWHGHESTVHQHLARHRVHGEWFKPTHEVLEYINERFCIHPFGPVSGGCYDAMQPEDRIKIYTGGSQVDAACLANFNKEVDFYAD